MKKVLSYLFVFAMVVMVAGTFASTTTAVVANYNIDGHVAICHSEGNGSYNPINPGVNGVLNGHADQHENDIIPPFPYGEGQSFSGLNWDTEGQAIYNNNCQIPQLEVVDACPNEQTDPGVQEHGPCNSDDVCPNVPNIQLNDNDCPGEPQDEGSANIFATKIVCPTEDLLPNWGNYGANITSTTATTFLASHPTCHTEPWTFEWAPASASNPGDNLLGAAGGLWTAFTNSVSVPAGAKVWVREQVDADYIPFSGAISNLDDAASKNSAEIYCYSDVLNYDNYDWIDPIVAGHEYYCVAFNVPTTPPVDECVATSGTVVSDNTTTVGDGNAFELSFIHPGWTADVDGLINDAKWIWATNPVESPTNDGDNTKVFTKTFTITGTPTDGTLDIAVDNNYTVKVNGYILPVVFDQNNFQSGTQDSYDISSYLVTGLNTIEITATNWESAEQSPDPAENPAGVLFKITWSSDCGELPPPPSCPEGYERVGDDCVPVVVDVCPPGTYGIPPSCYPIEVDNSADLAVIKTVDDETPDVGQQITYTLTVTNNGPDTATGVTVSELLPAGLTWISDDSSGNYNPLTGVWSIASIANGVSVSLHVLVSVDADTEGDVIPNTAMITHTDVIDSNAGNDSDSTLVTVNEKSGGGDTCNNDSAINFGGELPCQFPGDEETDMCPNITGVQTEVPDGKHTNKAGNCVNDSSVGGGGGSRRSNLPGEVLGEQTSVCNWDINTYMRTHYKNDSAQVKILQKDLLNGYMHLNIPVDGVYGPKTEAGVKAFQLAHKDKILTPWKLTIPTGIFYKTTLVEAKNTICPDQILPIPTDLINWSQNKAEVPAPL